MSLVNNSTTLKTNAYATNSMLSAMCVILVGEERMAYSSALPLKQFISQISVLTAITLTIDAYYNSINTTITLRTAQDYCNHYNDYN